MIEARAHFKPHSGAHSADADCRLGVGNTPATAAATIEVTYQAELSLTTLANALDPFNVSMSCENWGADDTDWYDVTITATPADQVQTVGL